MREAKTEIVERGPVRASVRQSLVLDNGQTYEAVIQLGLAQEAALVAEVSTVESPQAGFRFSLVPVSGSWSLRSDGPAALSVRGDTVIGESSGPAHDVTIALPAGDPPVHVQLDGQPVEAKRGDGEVTIALPDGNHRWELRH